MSTNQDLAVNLQAEFGVLSIKNPQFCTYLIVTSLLILKMCGLTLLTIFHRQKNKTFISEEDTKMRGGTVESNPDVERVRRAFLNDLENIPAFLIIGLAYLFVGVPNWVVHMLFYLFLIARVCHSFVYAVYVIPQPARAICFVLGFAIIGYMSIHVLIYGFFTGYLGK
ncbi:prostaglandin E synthase-like [Anthonomus grandis grandis]|uniref:prostaglandin E synthase-like n=1 Tax=Anthonomus grandis grandis TaxID=2921223 RepID=UPI0021656DBB|nr:prostaglandin E synthase-like [Anthonomus grandis grandis]